MSGFNGAVDGGNVKQSSIVDNLTTNDATKVLSAKQGKTLQDNKVNKSDIIDNLTNTATNKPLSAKMGKTLNEKKVRYYTGGALVNGAYDMLLVRTTVNFSNGNAEIDPSAILSSGDYTSTVAGCFAILGYTAPTSVITGCVYTSGTGKITISAKSTVDGSGITANNISINLLLLVA